MVAYCKIDRSRNARTAVLTGVRCRSVERYINSLANRLPAHEYSRRGDDCCIKPAHLGRPLSSKVIGHANIKITERNATLTHEHFQVIQIKIPTRKQLFHPSQPAHPQSSIPKEHSIQPHLDICAPG